MKRLPAAPARLVDACGQPACGQFEGMAASIDWSALAPPMRRSRWWRRFHHKRWHYVALAAQDVFAAVAIVDLGWTSTAFAYVFDRGQRRLLASYSRDGLPGMGAMVADHGGGASAFRFMGESIALDGRALALRCPGFAIDAAFEGTAPVLLACGPVLGGAVHATQKSGGLGVRGELRVGQRRISLDGAVASFDYSNGLLARDTAWRWASAHSRELGFNLQAGYFGAQENALWLAGHIVALDEAQFSFDPAAPLSPWQIRTRDGLLDLLFTPEGARAEQRNLLVAQSRYIQPIGTFSGTVRASADSAPVAVQALAGVTEDHFSRW